MYPPPTPIMTPEQNLRAAAAKKALQDARRAKGLPAVMSPVERLALEPTSKAKAIIAMCYQCMGEQPGWRQEVKTCTAPQCALFNLRPGKPRTKKE